MAQIQRLKWNYLDSSLFFCIPISQKRPKGFFKLVFHNFCTKSGKFKYEARSRKRKSSGLVDFWLRTSVDC
ncbi:hypothetical protein V6Z12_D12G047900 [Gossypium hirsutum]